MKTTHQLHGLGQSLWLDNITRGLLTSGALRRQIDELSVTGLTTKVGYSNLRKEIWQ
jgi:transaldolase